MPDIPGRSTGPVASDTSVSPYLSRTSRWRTGRSATRGPPSLGTDPTGFDISEGQAFRYPVGRGSRASTAFSTSLIGPGSGASASKQLGVVHHLRFRPSKDEPATGKR